MSYVHSLLNATYATASPLVGSSSPATFPACSRIGRVVLAVMMCVQIIFVLVLMWAILLYTHSKTKRRDECTNATMSIDLHQAGRCALVPTTTSSVVKHNHNHAQREPPVVELTREATTARTRHSAAEVLAASQDNTEDVLRVSHQQQQQQHPLKDLCRRYSPSSAQMHPARWNSMEDLVPPACAEHDHMEVVVVDDDDDDDDADSLFHWSSTENICDHNNNFINEMRPFLVSLEDGRPELITLMQQPTNTSPDVACAAVVTQVATNTTSNTPQDGKPTLDAHTNNNNNNTLRRMFQSSLEIHAVIPHIVAISRPNSPHRKSLSSPARASSPHVGGRLGEDETEALSREDTTILTGTIHSKTLPLAASPRAGGGVLVGVGVAESSEPTLPTPSSGPSRGDGVDHHHHHHHHTKLRTSSSFPCYCNPHGRGASGQCVVVARAPSPTIRMKKRIDGNSCCFKVGEDPQICEGA